MIRRLHSWALVLALLVAPVATRPSAGCPIAEAPGCADACASSTHEHSCCMPAKPDTRAPAHRAGDNAPCLCAAPAAGVTVVAAPFAAKADALVRSIDASGESLRFDAAITPPLVFGSPPAHADLGAHGLRAPPFSA